MKSRLPEGRRLFAPYLNYVSFARGRFHRYRDARKRTRQISATANTMASHSSITGINGAVEMIAQLVRLRSAQLDQAPTQAP